MKVKLTKTIKKGDQEITYEAEMEAFNITQEDIKLVINLLENKTLDD